MEQGENLRSSVHWANGVYEDKLLDMVSLTERGTTEQGNQPWNNLQAEVRWNGVRGEGQLRILQHADRWKVNDYDQEAIKNFLASNQDVITRET